MPTDTVMQPSRQALAAQDRSGKGMVTGRLKRALDEVVWAGACRADAAQIAGMTDHSLRAALKKPHVKQYYLGELGVLRESGRAKTFHRLEALRDQDENKAAAVKACQVLEQLEEQAVARPAGQLHPGLVIQIIGTPGPQSSPVMIEGEPGPAPKPRTLWINRRDEPVQEGIFQHPFAR